MSLQINWAFNTFLPVNESLHWFASMNWRCANTAGTVGLFKGWSEVPHSHWGPCRHWFIAPGTLYLWAPPVRAAYAPLHSRVICWTPAVERGVGSPYGGVPTRKGCHHPSPQHESSRWHVCAERPLQNRLYTFVYSKRSVHMYCQNKVSILFPLVIITSYCVGSSTYCYCTTVNTTWHTSSLIHRGGQPIVFSISDSPIDWGLDLISNSPIVSWIRQSNIWYSDSLIAETNNNSLIAIVL